MAGSDQCVIDITELEKRAVLRALHLLQRKSYTEKQLHDKLEQGSFPNEVIESTIEYMKSFRYVDDERYARDYIEYHSLDRPVMRLKSDLLKKGISRDMIENALEEFQKDAGLIDEAKMIRNYLKKKKFNVNGVSWQEKQKICAALMRKGFQIESIQGVLSLDIT